MASKQCRNLSLHGFCKFEGKGCHFAHNPTTATSSKYPLQDTQKYQQNSQYDNSQTIDQQTALQNSYLNPLYSNQKSSTNLQSADSLFIDEDIRQRLNSNSILMSNFYLADDTLQFNNYHSLVVVDSVESTESLVFGFHSTVYKAINKEDGKVYCLKRIKAFILSNEAAMAALDPWRNLLHSNIVRLKEAFTTRAFNDHSLVFVYDYHPNAKTLLEQFLTEPIHPQFEPQQQQHYTKNNNRRSSPVFSPQTMGSKIHQHQHQNNGLFPQKLSEPSMWSFVTQLTSALRAVHGAGLAARVLEPSKVLYTGKNRIRLNACGILDLLTFDSTNPQNNHQSTFHYQQQDLLHFGQLIVVLGCGTLSAIQQPQKALDTLSKYYSPDLKKLVLFLLSKPSAQKAIDDVFVLLGGRLLEEIEGVQRCNDRLEGELGRELENSRVCRLLIKMGFVNERPEFAMDPAWSETGDRYLIKLFRDHVFHTVNGEGRPQVDLGHVMYNLNKLDAFSEDKIMLMSRDEQSCLIVSYKEVAQCIETAFADLGKGL